MRWSACWKVNRKKLASRKLAQGGIVAALYIVLTVLLSPISFGLVQFRLAEVLCVLPCLNGMAVPGLFLGCVVSNLITGAPVFDVVFGSLATLVAAYLTYRMKEWKVNRWLIPLPTVLLNAVTVGLLLRYVYAVPAALPLAMLSVGAGEAAVLYALGLPLLGILEKKNYPFIKPENEGKMEDYIVKVHAHEEKYAGKFLHIFKDDIETNTGKRFAYEYMRHPGAACIVPMTDDGKVIMVRQYRYPFGESMLEAPAGKLDPGETPETAAYRELSEETGAEAREMIPLGVFYPSVAYTDEKIYLYLAKGLIFKQQHLDEDEDLSVEQYPLDKLVQMVLDGQIPDGKTQTVLLKAKAYLDKQ